MLRSFLWVSVYIGFGDYMIGATFIRSSATLKFGQILEGRNRRGLHIQ